MTPRTFSKATMRALEEFVRFAGRQAPGTAKTIAAALVLFAPPRQKTRKIAAEHTVIPGAVRRQMQDDPFMGCCIYRWIHPGVHECEGARAEPEWEHAFKYAGRKVQERWAIVPVDSVMHRVRPNKEIHQLVGLLRMTASERDEARTKYPRLEETFDRQVAYLSKKYPHVVSGYEAFAESMQIPKT